MNCSLDDARVLARCLDEHGHARARALPRFEPERRPNADALAALSLAHYEHLSQDPHPMDELRHREGLLLEQLEPYRFRPLCELVAFTDAPCPTIERLEAQRRALVDQLLQDPRLRGRWTDNVRELVASALRARLDQPGTTFA